MERHLNGKNLQQMYKVIEDLCLYNYLNATRCQPLSRGYIVNNHPLTRNKPIDHARISKQINNEGPSSHFICLRSERDKSVYFGQGVLIYFKMQLSSKKKYFKARRSAFRHLVYFVYSCKNHSADGIFEYRRYDNAFRCKSILSRLSLC